MTGRTRTTYRTLDHGRKVVVEIHAIGNSNEQHHAHVVTVALPDHDALADLRKMVDLAIDFSSPDPHSARVQGRVGSTRNHEAPMQRARDPVTVPPNTGVVSEIRGVISRPVGVRP